MMKRIRLCLVFVLGAVGTASPALASQLVFHPVNPTFGGNPLNGTYLLSVAQTQGKGVKSGQQQVPDLSGLDNALSNLGNGSGTSPIIIIGGNGGTTIPASP